MQEISINLDKWRVVECLRLGKTDRTVVKFLNRKDAEYVCSNKKKLKDVDISFPLSDDDIQDRNDMTTGNQNDWRERGLPRKRKIFVSQNLCSHYRHFIFLWFSQREEGRWPDFLFLGVQWNHSYEGVAGFMCN